MRQKEEGDWVEARVEACVDVCVEECARPPARSMEWVPFGGSGELEVAPFRSAVSSWVGFGGVVPVKVSVSDPVRGSEVGGSEGIESIEGIE